MLPEVLPPVELSEAPPLDMPLPVSPPLDAPPLVLPAGMSLLEVPLLDVPLLMLPVSDAPPLVLPLVPPGAAVPPEAPPGGVELVPPAGGVLGAAPGVSDGGGVDDEGVEVVGGLLGLLVVPVVPGSPLPPRLQAATLIVSKPIRIRSFDACSLGFIAIPFN